MNNNYNRMLLRVTVYPAENADIDKKVRNVFLRINNVLTGHEQLPNIAEICKLCDVNNKKLGAYIRNECIAVNNKNVMFVRRPDKPASNIVNIIEPSDRKKIRVVLFPGAGDDIDSFEIPESTHNMILRFTDSIPNFCATEVHAAPPSFYQKCSSEKNALLYLEGLLVDACMCHYLGISDVACFHDEKQHISSEKVQFLRELIDSEDLYLLNEGAQNLVRNTAAMLTDSTPYISFFSIFTIAQLDFAPDNEFLFFDQYCKLYKIFQRWYFGKHGRYFSTDTEIENPLNTVFYRNKYQGQISPSEITEKIQQYMDHPPIKYEDGYLGKESRFAVLILKHLPENRIGEEQLEALFPGNLHQAKWKIIYWGDLDKYEKHLHNLEVIPFIIDA